MSFRCPVCMYTELPYPPGDYHICPCCGTEFGNDDAELTHRQLRNKWIDQGAHWFFGNPPRGWSAANQLYNAGIGWLVSREISEESDFTVLSGGSMEITLPDFSDQFQLAEA